MAPGSRIGPYVYRRPIGKGGMALVLLAEDPDGNPVALKVLKAHRVGTGLTRFKREFRALARLRHPNVIRVDAYGDIHGHPYIAMEYVEGSDLHHLLHELRALDPAPRWRRTEEVLVELARALAYIHRRGLVHRDLKPSNVLIDPTGRCKLTDFGIVKALDPDSDTQNSTTLVGTWAYASPEQMSGQPIDHRSDLYSLGVILFAMLTGRRPFVAKDLAGYLELHRTHEAPAPSEVDPEVPPHLDEICRRLLKRSPRERYRSAREVLLRLERMEPEHPTLSFQSLPLVGRGAEMDTLHNAVAVLTRGEGGLYVVEGGRGMGRTRLLEEVAQTAALLALPVHRERAAKVDGTLGPLLRLANTLGATLGRRAPRDLAAAALECVGDEAQATAARPRLFAALAQAMQLALEDGPQVILLDDLQNVSLPMVEGILELHRALRDAPLLIVGALRNDALSTRFAGLRTAAKILPLLQIDADAMRGLTDTLVGPGRQASALARRLSWETQGVPLFLVAYLQNLHARGVLARDPAHEPPWRILADEDEIRSGHWEVPALVREVVLDHLSQLDADERQFAEALAVNGREADVDVLLEVLDLDEASAARVIDHLGQDGFIRQRHAGERLYVDFVQPKEAGVLYRELDTELRAELHRRLATTLALRFGHAHPAALLVGQHYLKSGDSGKAYEHLSRAARRLCDRGDLLEAWDIVQQARDIEDPAAVELDPTDFARARRHVEEVRADIFFTRGEWEDARRSLEQVVVIADRLGDEPLKVRGHLRLARVFRALGELDRAAELASEWLQVARDLHEREAVAEGLLVTAQVLWSRGDVDGAMAAWEEGVVHSAGRSSRRIRAHLILGLAAPQLLHGNLATAIASLTEAEAIYRELRLPGMRSVALAVLADVSLAQGDLGATIQNAEEALAVSDRIGAPLGHITANRVLGTVALLCGRPGEASPKLEAALAGARAANVVSEQLAAVAALAQLHLRVGDADTAKELLDETEALGTDGDPERVRGTLRALGGWARAAQGRRAAARVALADAETRLATLPELRAAQVGTILALGWQALGDPAYGSALAHKSARAAAGRGLRVFQLDALVTAARLDPDPAAQARTVAEARALLDRIAATVPVALRAAFVADRALP